MKRLLHIPSKESEYSNTKVLPLFLKGAHQLKVLRIADMSFLTAAPMEKVNLTTMRKNIKEKTLIEKQPYNLKERFFAYARKCRSFRLLS